MDKLLAAMRLTGVGFFIALSILGGVLAGQWLDGKLQTAPVFVIIGLFAGVIVAGYGVYKMLLPLLSDKSSNHRGEK